MLKKTFKLKDIIAFLKANFPATLIASLFLLILVACGGTTDHPITLAGNPKLPTVQGNYGHFIVTKNVDGDTIHVGTLQQPRRTFEVRFLEIDTPETHDPRKIVQCFGPEASRQTRTLLPVGTIVILKPDFILDKKDRYMRTLAYIYKKNLLINLKLVKLGYAHVYHFQGQRGTHAIQFDNAEIYAKKHHLGFWSTKTCNGDTTKAEPLGGFPDG